MKPGGNWFDDIPDEYQDGTIDDEDALAHAISIEYFADDDPDYMNPGEQELYDMPSDLDPLERILAEEDAEWYE